MHYIGVDVHKETIAVSIAPENSTEVRRYGIIGGTLDAVDKLVKKLAQENIELHLVYEAGPCGFVICRHVRRRWGKRIGTNRGDSEKNKNNGLSGANVEQRAESGRATL